MMINGGAVEYTFAFSAMIRVKVAVVLCDASRMMAMAPHNMIPLLMLIRPTQAHSLFFYCP